MTAQLSLPPGFLRGLGVEEDRDGNVWVPYFNPRGNRSLFLRLAHVYGPRTWPHAVAWPAAYGQQLLDREKGYVILTAWEPRCWVLWNLGFPALGLPGWDATAALTTNLLRGVRGIYLDTGHWPNGQRFRKTIPQRLAELDFRGQVLELPFISSNGGVLSLCPLKREVARDTVTRAIYQAQPLSAGGAGLATDQAKTAGQAYQYQSVDSAAFFSTAHKLEWVIRRLLVKGQPAVLGGPRKSLKTTTLVDLAVSLASGTPFLGHFPVYEPCRVVLISGESGDAVLEETARRVCAARGIDPLTLADNLRWSFVLPEVARTADRAALREGLQRDGAQVAIVDPLYLCLLAGADPRQIQAGNLYQMGPLLSALARACLDIGCTPLLAHHSTKRLAKPYEPMELEDLAFAGIAEFARQWLLLSRREPFDPETGSSKLWLGAGGSAGQSGLWAVDIEEGLLDETFAGRRWKVSVRPAREEREAQASTRAQTKDERARRCIKKNGTAILLVLDHHARPDGWMGYRHVQDLVHLGGVAMKEAVAALAADGFVEEGVIEVAAGRGGKRTQHAAALRRRKR